MAEENVEVLVVGAGSEGFRPACSWRSTGDLVRRAVFAGATMEAPVQEMFFGERYGRVVDPDGHRRALTIKREELTPAEIDARTPPEV
jgi:hypothetical protein